MHFVLFCPEYKEERQKVLELQQPYEENEEQILGKFLFSEENIEEKKETLYQMWRRREKSIKRILQS